MRMRIARYLAAASSGVALALIGGGDAHAQQQFDVNPPLPDVLLLVDNSGSMERMVDGTLPEASTQNACDVSNCVVANGTPPVTTCTLATRISPLSQFPTPNRWNTVLQALTGSPVNGFHCIAMPRTTGSTFATEYQIDNAAPYDTGYYLPYHRAVAMDGATAIGASTTTGSKPCVFAPGSLPGQLSGTGGVGQSPEYASGGLASAFPSSALINRPYGQLNVTNTPSPGITSTCNFSQNPDGLLDTYQDLIRFSFMTFDQDPSSGTGVTTTGTTPPQVLTSPAGAAFTGMWSYFPGWDGSSAANPATGAPIGCLTGPSIFEVGARNPAAPPWEGRMVYFPTDETTTTRDSQNAQIQAVLNATRPYGGTPMAGLFADAQYYFTNDPNSPNNPTSGLGDPLTKGGCRKQFIILLTDGAPNEDMRPACGANNNNPSAPCPYNQPDWTAGALANPTGGQNPIYTYVIGFAVSSATNDSGTLVNCELLNPATDCASIATTDALFPCCELQKIAVAGAPPNTQPSPHAYFANNPGDLQAALGAIFAQIAKTATTRTVPAYSAAVTNVTYNPSASSNTPNQEIFHGYFNPAPSTPPPSNGNLALVGEPWSGDITRVRYNCGGTPPTQTFSTSLGDDFAANLNTNSPSRYFIAVEATTTGGSPANSSATLRPYYALATGGDGLGNASVTSYPGSATTVVGDISPVALNLPAGTSSCPYTSNQGLGQKWLTDAQCAGMLMDFTFGQSFAGPSDFTFVSRAGNAFGGVYHATPAVVGPPASLLHDDSYDQFSTTTGVAACSASTVAAGTACRQQLVYAATTDGLLHAFWSDILTNNNNEQWAMVPPAVLPNLLSSYPASDKFLLDGSPVVKDVVWDRPQGSTTGTGPLGTNPWSTMLVAGFGPQQVGYYAIDITKPTASSVSPVNATTPGPVFRWQMTTMPTTNQPLFGQYGATPAITTVFVGSPPHEVGVAILPGGRNSSPTTPATPTPGGCKRATVLGGDVSQVGAYAYRTNVQCWGANGLAADPVVGRSVTVVRLDTGAVLATFMRAADAPANDTLFKAGLIVNTPLDSPMTGTPAVYPQDVGADGTQVFIGDYDGTLWKFDLSNTDPTQWTGKLFFDLYNGTVETASTAWSDGQPIALPLVTSLSPTGQLVVNVASGSQDQFTRTGLYLVYSLEETVQTSSGTSALRSLVNWYLSSSNDTSLTPPAPQLTAQPGVMGPGERVSGPMVVFDGTLYFATYQAPAAAALSCTAGDGHLWGRNYITPYDPSNVYEGGAFVQPATGPTPAYVDLATNGAVVPGVSVQATTACVGLGTAGLDQYVPGGSHTTPSAFTAGSFQLVGQVGATGGTSGAATTLLQLPTPREPTMISSWAAVTE